MYRVTNGKYETSDLFCHPASQLHVQNTNNKQNKKRKPANQQNKNQL